MVEQARRTIRSYVLRQGRLTPGQAKALEQYWHLYGIDYEPGLLDLDKVFGRTAPKILEIGSGAGENVLALAAAHPENDYLAVEVHKPGVGRLLKQAYLNNIRNIRVICHDVTEVLDGQLTDRSLDGTYIFFPDPWPKKRHHKRRLMTPGFTSCLCRRLKAHAHLFIATDWEDMAMQILEICDAEPELFNLAGKGNYAPRPHWRILTKFEQRGRNEKHQIWDLAFGVNTTRPLYD